MRKTVRQTAAVLALALCAVTAAFAKDRNVYAGAQKDVQSRIAQADAYIALRQYESANGALGSDDSDYIILKRVDLLTNYFVTSLMHQMFTLKDLEDGEDLMELRASMDGSFNLVIYDPATVVEQYAEEHGMTPALNLALGHYYYDVLMRYGDQWLKTTDELARLSIEHFAAAYSADLYNATYLNEYAELCWWIDDMQRASELYAQSVKLDAKNVRSWYNYAGSLMQQERYKDAIAPAKKAVQLRDKDDDYHLDAYLLLSDAYAYSDDSKNAHKTLAQAKAQFPQSGLPALYEGNLYLREGDAQKARAEFMLAYETQSDSTIIQNIVSKYYRRGLVADAIDFCTDALPGQSESGLNQGMLYFYIAQLEQARGNAPAASDALDAMEAALARDLGQAEAHDTASGIREQLGL